MNKKIILVILIFLILLPLATPKRLYTWGPASPISYSEDSNSIFSYDGFEYQFKPNGTVVIYKEGIKQGRFGFGLTGIFRGEDTNGLSSDFNWNYEILQNTPEVIEVKGSRTVFGNFPWEITLKAERYAPIKITHYLENNSNFDITDLQFRYYFDVNTEANPTVQYIDEEGIVQQYGYHTNQLRDDAEGLADLDFHNITVPFFNFQFQDIVTSGYSLSYLYFGNLDDLDVAFPDTNGYVVGFTKNEGVFAAHSSYEIDPTISAGANKRGKIAFTNGAFDAVVNGGGSFDIRTGNRGIGGNYLWDRVVIKFDLTSLTDIGKATLYLDYSSKDVAAITGTFDLNSVYSSNEAGGAPSDVNIDDWNATIFEVATEDWFDETISGDISTEVTTAWNNAISAGRTYLAFRLARDGDEFETSTTSDCSVLFRNTAPGAPPYIDYSPPLDANILEPNGNQYFSFPLTSDGNSLIDFNVTSPDDNYIYADIYYSSTAGAFTNAIATDLNLLWGSENQTDDFNCLTSDAQFGDYIECFYDFNFMSVADGNYFVDINVFDTSDTNIVDSSDSSFEIDATIPTTTDDANAGWQATNANVILSCSDAGSGCSASYYRLDTDSGSGVTYGNWQPYSSGVSVTTDGNFAITYHSVDNADNNGATSITYALLDLSGPTIAVVYPNGGEIFDVGTLLNIDFNVTDTESIELFASIYYSSSAGAFTNLIVADLNLNAHATDTNLTCDDTNWENSTHCDYNWGTSVVPEASYFIDVNTYDNFTNITSDSSDASFNIGRKLKFQFYDENTGAGLPNIIVFIDGNTFGVDSNGLSSIDTTNWASKFYSITAEDDNHHIRTWQWDLNSTVNLTANLALLDTNKGTTINFQFYDENGIILADTNVEALINNDKFASIIRTDSSGKATFFLNPNDFNYTFRVVQSDINIYLYSPTLVTVKVPKDEETNVVLPVGGDYNYTVSVDGIGARSFTNLSGDVSFFVLSDTADYYVITVDYNGSYYERKFHLRFPGNPDNYILQPYLVKTTETSTTITTQSIITFQPIPNVTIKIYKDLPGAGRTLIETVLTDSKGEALISGRTNETYDFEVYYNGVLIGTPTITVTSTTIIIQFNPLTSIPPIEGAYAEVYFYPPFSRLSKDNNYLDQNITSYQVTLESIHIFVVEDGNTILYDETFPNLDVNIYSNSIDVVNDLSAWDVNNFIDVYVDITLDGGFIIRRQMRYLGYDENKFMPGILYLMQNTIYTTMGCEAPDPITGDKKPCGNLYLISLFLTIGVCATVVTKTPYRDPIGMSVFAVIIMGFFAFLTWIDVYWLVFFALISFGAMLVAWRVS